MREFEAEAVARRRWERSTSQARWRGRDEGSTWEKSSRCKVKGERYKNQKARCRGRDEGSTWEKTGKLQRLTINEQHLHGIVR